jgi:hypothetical protein
MMFLLPVMRPMLLPAVAHFIFRNSSFSAAATLALNFLAPLGLRMLFLMPAASRILPGSLIPLLLLLGRIVPVFMTLVLRETRHNDYKHDAHHGQADSPDKEVEGAFHFKSPFSNPYPMEVKAAFDRV